LIGKRIYSRAPPSFLTPPLTVFPSATFVTPRFVLGELVEIFRQFFLCSHRNLHGMESDLPVGTRKGRAKVVLFLKHKSNKSVYRALSCSLRP